ncbi:MAG: LamG-like jellyroll fold domain-containing protein [Spirochaetota bacterium]
MKTILALAAFSLALLASACSDLGMDKPGAGTKMAEQPLGGLAIIIAGAEEAGLARTIIPSQTDLPAIAKYKVSLSRSGLTTRTGTYTSSPCAMTGLEFGDWTVSVDGLAAGDVIVSTGSATVTVAASTSVTVPLGYIPAATGKAGAARVTLLFPKTLGIDGVDAKLGSTALGLSIDNSDSTYAKVAYTGTGLALADPLLQINLKKGSVKLLSWAETLWIFQNLTTTRAETLEASAFSVAPTAPASLTATLSGSRISLSWPTANTAESYTLSRAANGSQSFSELVSGSSLPSGSNSYSDATVAAGSAYVYRLLAVNAFGSASALLSASVAVPNADATLSSLALSSGSLSPTFAAATTSYSASVANGVSSLTLTPTVNQANATVKVNNGAVSSGSASGAVTLGVGSNTVTVVVTAQDGATTKTYTVAVFRYLAGTATYLHFDNSIADDSGNGKNGTAVGSGIYAASGKRNQGIANPATTNFVYLPGANHDLSGDYTIAMWVKTAAAGWLLAKQAVDSATQLGNNMESMLWINGSGKAEFDIGYGSGYKSVEFSAKAINDSAWHFVCGVVSGTTIRISVDGAVPTTGTFSARNPKTDSALVLGGYPGSNSAAPVSLYPGLLFVGSMDEVSLYSRALSDAEIATLYACSQ